VKLSIREMPELIVVIDQALDTAQQDAVAREFLDGKWAVSIKIELQRKNGQLFVQQAVACALPKNNVETKIAYIDREMGEIQLAQTIAPKYQHEIAFANKAEAEVK